MVGAVTSGEGADPNRDVSSVLDNQIDWRSIIVTKDNLGLNMCIMGMEEATIIRNLDSGLTDELTSPTHLHINCFSHSIVLSCKEVTDRNGDVPSKMVRMGHLHESGRVSRDHLIALDAVVAERFRFYAVKSLPVDFAEWQRTTKHILKITRVAQDLKPEDEQFITDMDSGDWNQLDFDHWCLGVDLCPAECGGRPDTALPKMQ